MSEEAIVVLPEGYESIPKCGFCGVMQAKGTLLRMVKGATTCICEECVKHCQDLLDKQHGFGPTRPEREHYSTGNPWERSVGFSRAIRVGQTVYTAGTLASDADGDIHGADCYAQCCYIFDKLARVLKEAGAELAHVIKVTAFVVDIEDAAGFTRAHSEYLGSVKPVTTCVIVSGLFHPAARVELELTAVVP